MQNLSNTSNPKSPEYILNNCPQNTLYISRLSAIFRNYTGKWWICILFFLIATLMFGYLVPHGIDLVTNQRTLSDKILDEHIMTWTPADAQKLFTALGPQGREAYQHFYLHLDFYFPVLSLTICYISFLSLAFRANSKIAWINTLPIIMWLMDMAENIDHFSMAGSFPHLSDFSLTYGPWFTFIKWILIMALPITGSLEFLLRKKLHS